MTLKDIILRIPEEYRKEILETNMIQKAQSVSTNASMFYLFTIWKNHVEPSDDLKLECNHCLERVLNNYKQLLPTMIEVEKESRLLDSLGHKKAV